MTNPTTTQIGATKVQSTSVRTRRRVLSWWTSVNAARLDATSVPITFVAGTSEYIQLASTIGNASAPWNLESRFAGKRYQGRPTKRPLTTTTVGISYGGR